MTLFDTCGPTQTPEDIDIDALREKYAAGARQAAASGGRRRSTWNSRMISRSSRRSIRTRR